MFLVSPSRLPWKLISRETVTGMATCSGVRMV